MVEPGSLNDFLAQHKKKPKKAKGAKTAAAATDKTEEGTAVAKAEEQLAQQDSGKGKAGQKQDSSGQDAGKGAQDKNTNAFDDSDEEGESNIVLKDELRSKFVDKKDTESKTGKSDSKFDDGGWNLGSKRNEPREEPKKAEPS